MLRHLISMTYFYIYFNQFSNVLECYEETTVRRPAAATHTLTHKQLFTVAIQGSYMKQKFLIEEFSHVTLLQNYCKIIQN